MKGTRNWMIAFLILVGVGVTIWYNFGQGKEKPTQGENVTCGGAVVPLRGYCAPNFTLADLEGKKVELYQKDRKPTILNFWATWCSPCKEEMPIFQSYYDKYKDKIHFRMVNATALDDIEAVHPFMTKYKYTFPILLDPPDQKGRAVSKTYQVRGLPVTLGIAPDGKILFRKDGAMTEKELKRLIDLLEKSSQ